MPHRSLRQHQDRKSKSLSRVAIESLIIQPIQQIPRYPLLLQVRFLLYFYTLLLVLCSLSEYLSKQKLLTVTWSEHPDYVHTRQALQMMKALAVTLDCGNDLAKESAQKNKEEETKIEKNSLALRKHKKPQVRKDQLKLTLSVKPVRLPSLKKNILIVIILILGHFLDRY